MLDFLSSKVSLTWGPSRSIAKRETGQTSCLPIPCGAPSPLRGDQFYHNRPPSTPWTLAHQWELAVSDEDDIFYLVRACVRQGVERSVRVAEEALSHAIPGWGCSCRAPSRVAGNAVVQQHDWRGGGGNPFLSSEHGRFAFICYTCSLIRRAPRCRRTMPVRARADLVVCGAVRSG